MIRAFLALVLLTSAVGFAQVPKGGQNQNPRDKMPAGWMDPEHDPNSQANEEQKCQAVCGQSMSKCMMPCLGGDPEEAAKPENRGKLMSCVKKCNDANEPCMKGCEAKAKKKNQSSTSSQ